MAVRTLLSEYLAQATNANFDRVRAKFVTEDGTALTAVTQNAVVASEVRLAAGGDEAWRTDFEFDVHGLVSVAMSKANTSRPGLDDLRFVHLLPLLFTALGKAKVLYIVRPFWRCVVEDVNAPPPESWFLLSQSNLMSL